MYSLACEAFPVACHRECWCWTGRSLSRASGYDILSRRSPAVNANVAPPALPKGEPSCYLYRHVCPTRNCALTSKLVVVDFFVVKFMTFKMVFAVSEVYMRILILTAQQLMVLPCFLNPRSHRRFPVLQFPVWILMNTFRLLQQQSAM